VKLKIITHVIGNMLNIYIFKNEFEFKSLQVFIRIARLYYVFGEFNASISVYSILKCKY